jgi:D-arabinose 1-dehydrogenase-like Zn-dependent alcohol dehydrogenase
VAVVGLGGLGHMGVKLGVDSRADAVARATELAVG